MELLVVGASGFLGRNIIRLGSEQGWNVVGTYCKSKDFPGWSRRNGYEAVRWNLLGRPRPWSADVAIYLAGNSDHLYSATSPLSDLQLNAVGLVRFLEGFRGGLVFMSSAAVYEGRSGRVDPQSPIRPILPYAISKRACEGYVSHFEGMKRLEWSTILRLYYAFGPHDHPRRLIPKIIEAARKGVRKFHVTAPRGSLIDPLFVDDVSAAALQAARGMAKGKTLDLCGGRPRTVGQLVREAARHLRWAPLIVALPRPKETPMRFYSDPSQCRHRLFLPAPLTFREGVLRYLRWTEEREE